MSDDWNMENIPIGKVKVVTEPNPVTGEIKQITNVMGQIQKQVIQTKSDQVRNALIDMGWAPPEGGEHIQETVLPDNFRERWLPLVAETQMYGKPIKDMPLLDILAIVAWAFAEMLKEKKHDIHRKEL